jgi:chromosome segregation ATPase
MSAFATAGKYNDDLLQLNIDAEIRSVKRLQKAYEDLEEQIKNTYDISELNSTTKAAQDNLLAQINATERMIDAEKDKKKSDQDAIDDYKDEIDNLKKQYKELEETRLQELGAFATDENKKSGAETFLDAWMDAYKQTGDGLSGLNEQFDEFFEDSVKRQMLQKATSKYLENLFNKYDSEISAWAKGDLTDEELNEKLSGLKNDLPALNENLKKWAEATGIAAEFAGKDADLSGLQAGIQGITEDQADILAAYWSNVSLYTQDTNQKVNDLVTKLFSSDTDVNPMLSKIQELVMQTTAIKNHIEDFMRNGTSYVKVKLIE